MAPMTYGPMPSAAMTIAGSVGGGDSVGDAVALAVAVAEGRPSVGVPGPGVGEPSGEPGSQPALASVTAPAKATDTANRQTFLIGGTPYPNEPQRNPSVYPAVLRGQAQ